MITGASRAQAALLVIDAQEGVRENSKRHGYILSMLGIRQIAVLVNKMDLLDWDQKAFDAITHEYADFLARLGVHPTSFIPVSARDGANIVDARRRGAVVRRPHRARAGRGLQASRRRPRPAVPHAAPGRLQVHRRRRRPAHLRRHRRDRPHPPRRRGRLPAVGQALDGQDDRGPLGPAAGRSLRRPGDGPDARHAGLREARRADGPRRRARAADRPRACAPTSSGWRRRR